MLKCRLSSAKNAQMLKKYGKRCHVLSQNAEVSRSLDYRQSKMLKCGGKIWSPARRVIQIVLTQPQRVIWQSQISQNAEMCKKNGDQPGE